LHDTGGAASVFLREPHSKRVVIVETCYARNPFPQFRCSRPRSGPDFQEMVAQVHLAQGPGQELFASDPAPK
jgi:hypothetical protein